MALFFLSYDLRKARNYQTLYDELKRFEAVLVLESLWCFKRFNTNANGLTNHFRKFIDTDDGLIVIEASDWASVNTLGTPNDLK